MTDQKDGDSVTLNCSVSPNRFCRYRLRWLYEDVEVDKNKNKDLKLSSSQCWLTVTFLASEQRSKYRELFKCDALNFEDGKWHLFTFRPQTSGEKYDGELFKAALS